MTTTSPALGAEPDGGRGSLRLRAQQTALAVAARLADPHHVAEHMPAGAGAVERSSVYAGHCGAALLFARLAAGCDMRPVPAGLASGHETPLQPAYPHASGTATRRGSQELPAAAWSAAAFAHVVAASGMLAQTPPSGAMDGPGGIILTGALAARHDPNRTRWAPLLAGGPTWLIDRTLTVTATCEQGLSAGLGVGGEKTYDAVSGLAGLLRALLAISGDPALPATTNVQARHAAAQASAVLGAARPTAGRPPQLAARRSGREHTVDTGAAHGAAGVTAALALAHHHQIAPAAQAAAAYADWLGAHLRHNPDGAAVWPTHVPAQAEVVDGGPAETPQIGPDDRQHAWCYGAAGIGRALYLAGRAVNDRQLRLHGVNVLAGLASRDRAAWGQTDPGVCHGLAGVLQAVTRTAAEHPDRRLEHLADLLAELLLARYDPETAFGYHLSQPAPCGQPHTETEEHWPGVLVGAAGIAAALLDYATGPLDTAIPTWDSVILLS